MAKNYDDIFDIDENYSLESILAEYKGSAYISGDKKTPSDELEQKTEQIIKEVTGSIPDVSENSKNDGADTREARRQNTADEPPRARNTTPAAGRQTSARISNSEINDTDDSFEPFDYAAFSAERQTQTPPASDRRAFSSPRRAAAPKYDEYDEYDEYDDYDEYDEYDEYEDEPSQSIFSRLAARLRGGKKAPASDEYDEYDEYGDEYDEYDDHGETAPERDAAVRFDTAERPESAASAPSADRPRQQTGGVIEHIDGASGGFDEYDEYDEYDEADEYEPADDEWETPDFADEIRRIIRGNKALSLRCSASFAVSVILAVITLGFEFNILPISVVTAAGILLIGQIITMLIGVEVMADGLEDFIKAEPGAESLIFVSNIVICLQAFLTLGGGSVENGLPFCALASFAVYYALRGRRLYYMGIAYSLKTALSSGNPYSVISEYGKIDDMEVLKKSTSLDGFYKNLTQEDIAQSAYSKAAPLFMLGAVVLAMLSSIVRGRVHDFTYTFAAIIAVATSLSATMAYNMPFYITARKTRKSGGVVAGWGGACDMFNADGALITDEDLFPTGTVSLGGIKLFEGISQYKAIVYAASLISASGSGLTKCFNELLLSQNGQVSRVDDFACYEGGGIGGVISRDQVYVGSAGFMSLMGIRVPDSLNMKSAVYLAINGELKAVFSINYIPANSVQSALVSLVKARVNMMLAARDFNITPAMLQQKFKISLNEMEYVPTEDCYRISDEAPSAGCTAAAVICREGLGPYAEVIIGGIQLKNIATITTVASIVSSVIGMLLVTFICWRDELATVSAGNILIMMLAVQIATLLLARLSAKR